MSDFWGSFFLGMIAGWYVLGLSSVGFAYLIRRILEPLEKATPKSLDTPKQQE